MVTYVEGVERHYTGQTYSRYLIIINEAVFLTRMRYSANKSQF